MITSEQFLDDTKEEEVFALIHEFKERFNALMKEEHKSELPVILDADINCVAEQMITSIKSQVWLGKK